MKTVVKFRNLQIRKILKTGVKRVFFNSFQDYIHIFEI